MGIRKCIHKDTPKEPTKINLSTVKETINTRAAIRILDTDIVNY